MALKSARGLEGLELCELCELWPLGPSWSQTKQCLEILGASLPPPDAAFFVVLAWELAELAELAAWLRWLRAEACAACAASKSAVPFESWDGWRRSFLTSCLGSRSCVGKCPSFGPGPPGDIANEASLLRSLFSPPVSKTRTCSSSDCLGDHCAVEQRVRQTKIPVSCPRCCSTQLTTSRGQIQHGKAGKAALVLLRASRPEAVQDLGEDLLGQLPRMQCLRLLCLRLREPTLAIFVFADHIVACRLVHVDGTAGQIRGLWSAG
ncbi:unnamed protein product [Symbiodinium natans]|uniref:Uncharacterized protein n=1 Tax=Symbiodinium natans TaxID=878477 RepID=A0A812QY29_9DINO|nr:unnamed protein product [Symbiodinium natans]